MAVTVQMQFASAVTEMAQKACVGSSIENGTTVIQFALRPRDFQRALGPPSPICWRQDVSPVAIHALSTFQNPLQDRLIVAQGSDLHDQKQRVSFPPAIQGGSTSQPMSTSLIRLCCSLAVVCGVSRRQMALILAALFLRPLTQSASKRWIEDSGSQVPPPEERLRHLLAIASVTAGHMDGASPVGTAPCVRGVQDAQARILLPQEAASEHGAEARRFLPQLKDRGLKVPAAFADDSPSCPEAIQAVVPHARFQADHVHTGKHGGGHLKQARCSSRWQVKASGEAQQEEACLAGAKPWWNRRGSLRKKPGQLSAEEKPARAALESEETGVGPSCRTLIRPLVPILDHTHSAAQAPLRLPQLRKAIPALAAPPLHKRPQCWAAHGEPALRYLRNKGMGTHRRGSNSESGMRRLRRLEKNPEGLRSAATRQHYMQIYQAMQDLSLDMADFIEKGPQLAELPRV